MACCCGNRACISVAAGIYSTVLSLVLLIIFIFFNRIHECDFIQLYDGSVPGLEFFGFIFFVYFYNADCNVYTIPNVTDQLTFPDVVEPSERTYIWTLVYIALNAAWLLSSILLISGCTLYNRGRGTFLAVPWILVTIGVIGCDIATSVMYGLDIEETKTINLLLDFIGVQHNAIPDSLPEYITSLPSIILTVIFAKAGLFWLVTVCFLICLTCNVCRSPPKRLDQLYLQTRPPPDDFYTPAQRNPAYEPDDRTAPYPSDDEVTSQGYRDPQDYLDLSPHSPRVPIAPRYSNAMNRDPRYDRYLETLQQQTPPSVNAHAPWSYLRPNSSADSEHQRVNYELHTPPPRKQAPPAGVRNVQSTQDRPIYDSNFVITQGSQNKNQYYY